jgi:hypothetical protein
MRGFAHIYRSDGGHARENLDTEHITFTMFNLWLGTIERSTTGKLNGNF